MNASRCQLAQSNCYFVNYDFQFLLLWSVNRIPITASKYQVQTSLCIQLLKCEYSNHKMFHISLWADVTVVTPKLSIIWTCKLAKLHMWHISIKQIIIKVSPALWHDLFTYSIYNSLFTFLQLCLNLISTIFAKFNVSYLMIFTTSTPLESFWHLLRCSKITLKIYTNSGHQKLPQVKRSHASWSEYHKSGGDPYV